MVYLEASTPLEVIIDSGSDISAMPSWLIPKGYEMEENAESIRCQTAGGPIIVSHQVSLMISSQIKGDLVRVDFKIMDSLQHTIIGCRDMDKLQFLLLFPSISPFRGCDQIKIPIADNSLEEDVPLPSSEQQVLSDALLDVLKNHKETQAQGLPCSHPLAMYTMNIQEGTTWDKIQPPEYQQPESKQLLIDAAIEKEIELGWLTPITKDHPLQAEAKFVVVMNNPSKPRVCINAVYINKHIEDVLPHIPNLEAALQSIKISVHTIFSKIDISKAYYACPWDPSQHGLVYVLHKGVRYGYTRCPFGLKDLPNHFCRLMKAMMGGIPGVVTYFDDILIFSDNMVEHISTVKEVINRCTKWNFPINTEKSRFGYTSVSYLGMRLSREGLAPSPSRVKGIMEMKFKPTMKDLRRFLGLINYCRRFILGVSELLEPLEELKKEMGDTATKIPKSLIAKFNTAIHTIKDALCRSIVLAIPPENPNYVIHTDASDIAVAGVLGFVSDDEFRVCSTFSKKLKDYELNWTVPRKELYAIVKACKVWESQLLGRKFLIKTDHRALIFQLPDLRKLPRVLDVWANFLSGFNYQIHHVAGDDNIFADLLSRAPYNERKNAFLKELDDKHEAEQQHEEVTSTDKHSVRSEGDDPYHESVAVATVTKLPTPSRDNNISMEDWNNLESFTAQMAHLGFDTPEDTNWHEQIMYDPSNLTNVQLGYPVHSLVQTPLDSFLGISEIPNHLLDSPSTPEHEKDTTVESTRSNSVSTVEDITFVNFISSGGPPDAASQSRDEQSDVDVEILAKQMKELRRALAELQQKVTRHNSLVDEEFPAEASVAAVVYNTFINDNNNDGDLMNLPEVVDLTQYDTREQRLKIIKYHHDFAHESTTRLVDRLKKNGHNWTGMQSEVKFVVDHCIACIVNNYGKKMFTKAHSVKSAYPFDVVQVDTAQFGTTTSINGVRYSHLMVVIDVFTGFIILEPLRSTTKREATKAIKKIFGRFGPPRTIITDGGPEYTDIKKAVAEAAFRWGSSVTRETTTPHTSRATGRAERAIQDVKRLIFKFCRAYSSEENYKRHWGSVLADTEFGLNTRIHPANRLSPFQLVFNRIPNAFLPRLAVKLPPSFSVASFLDDALHQLKAWNGVASLRNHHYALQAKKLDDSRRVSDPIPIGAIVFYQKNPKGLKFSPWQGPYVVVGHDEHNNHVIKAITYGLPGAQQLDPEVKAHTISLPRDRLKATPQFNLDEFVHWYNKDTIVGHSYIDNVLHYRVRRAHHPPLFDQDISHHELKGHPLVDAYRNEF